MEHPPKQDIAKPAPKDGPSESQREDPLPANALALFFGALVLLILFGTLFQRILPGSGISKSAGPLGIALTEVLAILLPAVVFRILATRGKSQAQARLGVDAAERAPLRAFGLRLLGGVLLGFGCFYMLSVWLEPLFERVLPVPPEERVHLLRLLRPETGLRPLWQDLFCFAAVPALCEEVLFRGAILSALGAPLSFTSLEKPRRRHSLGALLCCALLFGVFHLSASKFLPTTLLGLGFGIAALLGASLVPAIAMHFTNNALVVLLVRAGFEEAPPALRTLFGDRIGPLWLFLSLLATLLGAFLLRRIALRPKAHST